MRLRFALLLQKSRQIIILRASIVQTIDVLTTRLAAVQSRQIPTNVFTRNPRASQFTIKFMQRLNVRQNSGAGCLHSQRIGQRAMLQKVRHIGKQPRLTLRGSPNQNTVCARLLQHLSRFSGGLSMSPFAHKRSEIVCLTSAIKSYCACPLYICVRVRP